LAPAPEDCAVPELLVPGLGGEAILDELPAPLGSLSELLRPPALAGPEGTPLTPADPAPALPALGVPTALGLPADEPLAAPAAPLVPPPPAPPPALPPPPCANAAVELARHANATQVTNDNLVIDAAPFFFNPPDHASFPEHILPPGTIVALKRLIG
jgi:hypothetical protein